MRLKGFVFILLCLLFFNYRLLFWKDFAVYWLQIVVNTLFDVSVSYFCFKTYGLIRNREFGFIKTRLVYNIFLLIVLIPLFSVLLSLLHYAGYSIAGFNPVFSNTYRLFSFQVFDSLAVVFTGTLFFALADALEALYRSRLQLQTIEKEKTKNELEFLRSQINPHFVFNAINSIYFLIDSSNKKARAATVDFADLFRYHLYESSNEKVSIEKETEFIRSFVSLQQYRFDPSMYRISLHMQEDMGDCQVAPLLLLPLVENAFKHVSHWEDRINAIDISLAADADRIVLRVSNSCTDEMTGEKTHNGLGLTNLRRRLELLYPDAHELSVQRTGETYESTLSIRINGGTYEMYDRR